jgi:uncharacterized protein (TIGR02246 family)
MRYVILCVLFAYPRVTFAQQAAAKHTAVQNVQSGREATQQSVAASVESRVRAAWEAFKVRDKDRYAEFLADEFQAVEADGGGERSRARILLEVEHSMYTDYLLQLFQVRRLGPDYAFVTYEATIQFPAGSAARYKRIFIGELWIWRNGEWKMMRYQETPVG